MDHRIHNVNQRSRAKLLQGSSGHSDVFMDLRGTRYLPPKERAIIDAQADGIGSMDVEKVSDNLDVLPPWYWNPSNPQATHLPAGISMSKYHGLLKKLHALDSKISITFHGARHVWQLWYYKPGFCTEFGNGWVMCKEFKPQQGTAYILKVVERMDSLRVGSSTERHRKAVQERTDHKEKARKERFQLDLDNAAAAYEYTQIKNYGMGNKSQRFG